MVKQLRRLSVPRPSEAVAATVPTDKILYSAVDPERFVLPVRRMGVSGGTAPFFSLHLRGASLEQFLEGSTAADPSRSSTYWIGKDLGHAIDEVGFYEQRRTLSDGACGGFGDVFRFMFDYEGVLECSEEGADTDAPPLRLLVLRNLHDGCSHLRMVDIKMGEKTACAGWQGKSWLRAMRQAVMDGLTNSQVEGFRLEGFDGPPPGLESLNPLLDLEALGAQLICSEGQRKKAHRMMLQRLFAAEVLMHLFDVHQVPEDPGLPGAQSVLTPTELAEALMSEMVRRLAGLAAACVALPVPQKWIGSSVALGFDDGELPPRGAQREVVVKSLRVHIFDWGRSELNTPEHHAALSSAEREDRSEFWKLYKSGMGRLSWEVARAYWHRFCNTTGWASVCLDIYDYDSVSANDHIGQVEVPLKPAEGITLPLLTERGKPVRGSASASTITVSIAWRDLPEGGSLRGCWRVSVLCASCLPAMDRSKGLQTSDPFVVVRGRSETGLHDSFRQESTVIVRNVDPEWNETFELPLACECPAFVTEMLAATAGGWGTGPQQQGLALAAAAEAVFPNVGERDAEARALELWQQHLSSRGGRS